jgi:hypothetical protein
MAWPSAYNGPLETVLILPLDWIRGVTTPNLS